jgi:hypothetical protein
MLFFKLVKIFEKNGGVGDGADAIFNLTLIRIAGGIYDSRNFEQKQLKMA